MFTLLPELVPLVLNNLYPKDIYQYMKSCKKSYSEASSIYYNSIVLNRNKHRVFLQATEQTRVDGSRIGDFVQKIEIYGGNPHSEGCTCFLTKDEFCRLLENLPQLGQLMLPRGRNDTYLKYLQTVPVNHLRRIQEISIDHHGNHQDHYLANLAHMDRITTFRNVNFFIPSRNLDILSQFSNFTNLKHLDLDNIREPFGLIPILNACPNLTIFESRYTYYWGKIPANGITLSNLTCLKLTVHDITYDHINYMMQYIPYLKTLILLCERSFMDVLLSLGKDCSRRFQLYLKQIPNVRIENATVDKRNHTIQDISTRNNVITDFIQGVYSNDLLCNFTIDFASIPNFKDHFVFDKQQGRSVNIRIVWLEETDYAWIARLNSVSITIKNSCLYNSQNELVRIHSDMLQPMTTLLDGRSCPILVRNLRQRLYFYNTKFYHSVVDGLQSNITNRRSQVVNFGYIKNVLLTDELLQALGRYYPSVENLVLKNCKMIRDSNRPKQYHIDLTQFNDIHQLVFDLDAILSKRKLKQTLYILFVSANSSSDCYYYDERNRNMLEHYQNEHQIPQSAYVVKIKNIRIQNFIFKRHKNEILFAQ